MDKKSPTIQEGESGATGFYGFLGGKNEELIVLFFDILPFWLGMSRGKMKNETYIDSSFSV